jgi:1,4-dihydroxy-6-naphthoate synthase
MTLTLGFSPCPNDTFIFDALLHGKVDTEGLRFEAVLEDVEALNRRAANSELHITKLSYHAFAYLTAQYALLHAGSALGNNCGPLLISKSHLSEAEVEMARIAIPGERTTANFLLGIAYPQATDKVEMLFSDIEEAVLRGEVDAGLIIHENRFTYQQKGLRQVTDLGAFWESSTGLPIPLGGIVVRRDLPHALQLKIDRVLRRSVEQAFADPQGTLPYVRRYAQAMDDAVMKAHIDLYVTNYTVDLGLKGRAAVEQMFRIAAEKGIIPAYRPDFFV